MGLITTYKVGKLIEQTQAALSNPDYRSEFVAITLGELVKSIQQGRAKDAKQLLDAINKASGSPLQVYNSLASRDLWISAANTNHKNERLLVVPRTPLPSPTAQIKLDCLQVVVIRGEQVLKGRDLYPPAYLAADERTPREQTLVEGLTTALTVLGHRKPLLQAWAELCDSGKRGDSILADKLRNRNGYATEGLAP